jgi:hypothetical protein
MSEEIVVRVRTQDEIVARIKAISADDLLGFGREVLIDGLDFEHARPFLAPRVDAGRDWSSPTRSFEVDARHYLEFAIGKILGHRGISAGRSVDKLREWAWLLCRDDVVQAMDVAEYPQYGAPKVKAFALGLGWPWPSDNAALERMATGLPCVPDCASGCGL